MDQVLISIMAVSMCRIIQDKCITQYCIGVGFLGARAEASGRGSHIVKNAISE